jgi:hypothetical protein
VRHRQRLDRRICARSASQHRWQGQGGRGEREEGKGAPLRPSRAPVTARGVPGGSCAPKTSRRSARGVVPIVTSPRPPPAAAMAPAREQRWRSDKFFLRNGSN